MGVKEFTSVVAAAAELHTKLWVEAGSQMQRCKQECFNCHCMMCDMPCPHWHQCVFVYDLITIGKQRWNWVWTASCHILRCAWNQGLLEPLSSSNIPGAKPEKMGNGFQLGQRKGICSRQGNFKHYSVIKRVSGARYHNSTFMWPAGNWPVPQMNTHS